MMSDGSDHSGQNGQKPTKCERNVQNRTNHKMEIKTVVDELQNSKIEKINEAFKVFFCFCFLKF